MLVETQPQHVVAHRRLRSLRKPVERFGEHADYLFLPRYVTLSCESIITSALPPFTAWKYAVYVSNWPLE